MPTHRSHLAALLMTLILAGSAGSMFVAGAGTAVAPEPASLTNSLGLTSTPAVYYGSRAPTTAYFLPANWTPSSLPVGSACSSTGYLPKGSILTSVIVGNGGYRKCSPAQ